MSIRQQLEALRRQIPSVTALEARDLQRQGAWLIDIREPDEIAQGSPATARRLGRGFLELRLDNAGVKSADTLLLMCASGSRSLLAADQLGRLGYQDVRSVAGGFDAWKAAGLDFEMPRTLNAEDRARYARQLSLPEIGVAGQAALRDARVLVIGAGGLGTAALYLASAGVGQLTLVDHDTVDRSNLHRQILHRDASVGQAKVHSAHASLAALNPTIEITPVAARVGPENAAELVAGHDLVVDGSDNFQARYAINDACVAAGVGLVYGAIERFTAQVAVFPAGGQPCYRCLFAKAPPAGSAPSCAEAGVIGAIPGIVGSMQALEAIKMLVGMPDNLAGKLLSMDLRRQNWRTLAMHARPQCPTCGNVSH